MLGTPTLVSLLGAGLYSLVLISVLAAIVVVRAEPGRKVDLRVWFVLAAIFAALIAVRLFDMEHRSGAALREWATMQGLYSDRHALQRWMTATLVILAATAAAGGVWWTRYRNGPAHARIAPAQRFAAAAAVLTAALVGFAALRFVSLHAIDHLIYGGRNLRLNYVIDAGLSCAVGLCALMRIGYANSPRKPRS